MKGQSLCYTDTNSDDAPFPLKSTLKVTHLFEKRRLRPISAYNLSTIRDSKTFNYDEYEVDHGLSNEL